MPRERRLEPLVEEHSERDVERAHQRDRGRKRCVELRLRRARPLPVVDEPRRARAGGGVERGGRDGHECEPGRAHQCLLRPGDDDVDSPGIRLQRHGAERRDGIDDDQGVGFLGDRGEGLHVRDNAGRGLRVHDVDDADVTGVAKGGAQVVRLRRLAPFEPDVHEVGAERLHQRGPPLAEAAGGDHDRAFACRRQIRDCRLEGSRPRRGEHEDVVLGPVHLAQAREAAFVDLTEVPAAVMDDRLGQRREHLRRHGRRPRRHQVTLLRHSPGG